MTRQESFRDLDNLLAQIQDRHPVFSNVTVILSVLGIFGLLCLLGVIR